MHLESIPQGPSESSLSLGVADPEPRTAQWAELVNLIRDGDESAAAQLYEQLRHGLRYIALRQIGGDHAEDVVQETMVKLLSAIRRGELRDPARLAGWVRTVMQRLIIMRIREATARRVHSVDATEVPLADRGNCPEKDVLAREQADLRVRIMHETLMSLPPRDREILSRFYLRAQTQEQICKEMGLTDTQFRLAKSRAKQKFEEKGKRLLSNTIRPLRRAASS